MSMSTLILILLQIFQLCNIALAKTSEFSDNSSSSITTATAITTNNGIISIPSLDNTNNESKFWNTCSSHPTCTECYTGVGCHWCAHDGACHAKGAPLGGCTIGASCTDDGDTKEQTKSCADYKTCQSCSNSSWECHWCNKDETCHAKGSMHGCTVGTDCYAINRCQRIEPEQIDTNGIFSSDSFVGVGPVAKALLGVLLGLVLCCSTMCFGGVTFLKCAVDDLVGEPVEIVEDGVLMTTDVRDSQRQQERQNEKYQYDRVVDTAEAEEEEEEGSKQRRSDNVDDDLEMPLMQNEVAAGNEDEQDAKEKGVDKDQKDEEEAGEGVQRQNESSTLTRRRSDVASISQLSRRSSRITSRNSSIKRMYCGCQLCYLVTIITSIILFIAGMAYAPRKPVYNVCTNEVAWKSIIEGMASIKLSASFDLLISVYNPNKFEVDLSNGHGQFHHDDQYVGSFDIPEGRISENAISDIVVKVSFSPDKWTALSLTSEYYQGKLQFVIGGHAHVTIPGLGNYQFDAKFDDIHIHVNDLKLDDTHLCACPGWKKPIDLI